MKEYMVTFKHPDGPVKALEARNALENMLVKQGFSFMDTGTMFDRCGDENTYRSTDLTVRGSKKFPEAEVKHVLQNHGVEKYGMKVV